MGGDAGSIANGSDGSLLLVHARRRGGGLSHAMGGFLLFLVGGLGELSVEIVAEVIHDILRLRSQAHGFVEVLITSRTVDCCTL